MFILNFDIGLIFPQQSVATEYLHLTEDNNRGRKDYYLEPHDSDPTVPVTRANVYDRLVLSIKHLAFILEKFSHKRVGLSIPGISYHKGANKSPAKELPNISSTINTLCYVISITDR